MKSGLVSKPVLNLKLIGEMAFELSCCIEKVYRLTDRQTHEHPDTHTHG